MLVLEKIDLLEARVIVNKYEKVQEAVVRPFEWSGEVAVDESADV